MLIAQLADDAEIVLNFSESSGHDIVNAALKEGMREGKELHACRSAGDTRIKTANW